MKRWYLFYYQQYTIGHQVGDQLKKVEHENMCPTFFCIKQVGYYSKIILNSTTRCSESVES